VQVDPVKPTLKAPGTKRLKPKYDEPLSKFAFKFNLRRYNEVHNVTIHTTRSAVRCIDKTAGHSWSSTPPIFCTWSPYKGHLTPLY